MKWLIVWTDGTSAYHLDFTGDNSALALEIEENKDKEIILIKKIYE